MPLRPKHVPQRTCIACRNAHREDAKQAKRDLIRIVRSPSGTISVDPRGKLPGRGAYLCENRGCWEAALSGNALVQALKMPALSGEDRQVLLAFAQSLPTAPESSRTSL
ncbi:MAG: YlxR family protein [Chloroflexi bacterium]|nr:YlxR family protein [Chloroflexota bacterium]